MSTHTTRGAWLLGVLCLTSDLWVAAAPGARAQDAAPLDHSNVVVLLDASGSMNHRMQGSQMTRMAAAFEKVEANLDALREWEQRDE